MNEEQKNNQPGIAETGAAAADLVRGAVKTGKAVAGTAKGAAMAGPYGALAGALWGSRKHIGMILLTVTFLFLLPVMVVMMLPSLIFGGLTSAFSPSDPYTPVINSSTAVTANTNEIAGVINDVLKEGIADVEKRIQKDFDGSDCDCMEINNPYENMPAHNVSSFISQYSAYRNDDYKSTSLKDMEKLLKDNLEHLYSYTWRDESRERLMTEEEIKAAEAEKEAESGTETGGNATGTDTEGTTPSEDGSNGTSSASSPSESSPAPASLGRTGNGTADSSSKNGPGASTDTSSESSPGASTDASSESCSDASTDNTTGSDSETADSESDSEPEVPPTVTEKWRIYTIVYNGETYFADKIFKLTDRQKVLADNYAQNLARFLGYGLN